MVYTYKHFKCTVHIVVRCESIVLHVQRRKVRTLKKRELELLVKKINLVCLYVLTRTTTEVEKLKVKKVILDKKITKIKIYIFFIRVTLAVYPWTLFCMSWVLFSHVHNIHNKKQVNNHVYNCICVHVLGSLLPCT